MKQRVELEGPLLVPRLIQTREIKKKVGKRLYTSLKMALESSHVREYNTKI